MTEIFTELPIEVRNNIQLHINFILKNFQLLDAAEIIRKFANSCINKNEQDFIDFYFNLKLEEMQKEYV